MDNLLALTPEQRSTAARWLTAIGFVFVGSLVLCLVSTRIQNTEVSDAMFGIGLFCLLFSAWTVFLWYSYVDQKLDNNALEIRHAFAHKEQETPTKKKVQTKRAAA